MNALTVYIDGIGFWAPGIADWPEFLRALGNAAQISLDASAKPSPASLPPAERRRAPEPVLIASEAAGQACAMAGCDPATLAGVFTSTHGDLAITDTMCATLAADPRELSPTKFHNSVHNAPAGYWTVATHCHATATAISAAHASFAAGLFEAAIQACSEDTSVLLCAYDIASRGPLMEVSASTLPFAAALVLNPARSAASLAALHVRHAIADREASAIPTMFTALAGNPMAAQALPLLAALAQNRGAEIAIGAGAGTALVIEVAP